MSLWGRATTENRKALYRLCRALINEGRLSWPQLYAEALSKPAGFGSGYDDNFRAGKISRRNAASIASYLARTYPDIAEELPLPAPMRPVRGWQALLDECSRPLDLEVVVLAEPQNLVFEAKGMEFRVPRSLYYFVLTCGRSCSVASLSYNTMDGWLPVQLKGRGFVADLSVGPHELPMNDQGARVIQSWPLHDDSEAYVFFSGRTVGIRNITKGWRVGEELSVEQLDEIARLVGREPTVSVVAAMITFSDPS